MKLFPPLMLIVLLTGCTIATSQPATLVVSTNTQEMIAYTSTFSTPTIPPTDLPTATPTLTYTLKPIETSKPTSTVTPVWMGKMEHFSAWGLSYSPDKNWIWGASENDIQDSESPMVFHTTRFVSADGKVVWDVQPKLDQIAGHTYTDVSYEPIFWLPNEPYVYLTARVCCVDGASPGFFRGMNLARLDLSTGKFSMQIAEWGFHEFIFSPNGKYLFEALAWKPEVHLIRLLNWNQDTIMMPAHNRRNGGGAWSPDNQKIIFYSCEDVPQDEWKCGRFSLILIDSGMTPQYRILVSDMKEATGMDIYIGCNEMEWKDPDKIRIYMRGSCDLKDQWTVDVNTGQVEKIN